MGRLRAVLQPEPQPDAQVYPELQLQGTGHQAQIIILLVLRPGCNTVPVERCATIYQPGCAYHSTHEDRDRERWDTHQPEARQEILSDLFPDLGKSSSEDWDYQQSNVLLAFMK